MDCLSTGGQLQQFFCAMQWPRFSIIQFQVLMAPLHTCLEAVYTHVAKRANHAVARVPLDKLRWTSVLSQSFDECKTVIAERITLAHRDDSKRLCNYKDASETHWSGILTEVPLSDISLPHSDQAYEPLAFHFGLFSATQMGCSTVRKEAYAVLAFIERSHWLAACPARFNSYSDHNNLLFIFDPTAVMPDLGRGVIRKFLRLVVLMSLYNYACIQISGADNLRADLLTRWTTPLTI